MSDIVPAGLRRAVLCIHGERCFYCGSPAGEVDHIDAKAGSVPENLTACCRTCNAIKGARAIPESTRHEARVLAFIHAPMVASMASEYRGGVAGGRERLRAGPLPIA